MAGLRHGFVSRDGRLLPGWEKVGGRVEALASSQPVAAWIGRHDLYWIHAPAGDAGKAHVGAVRVLASRAPCVVLADIPEDLGALECLAAGARGYCNSHADARVLKLVADVVMRGGLWVGESLLQRMVQGVARLAPAPLPAPSSAPPTPAADGGSGQLAALSRREREVADAVAAGGSNKDVARQLGITERTVKAHLSTIFDKLGVKDRLQLAVRIIALRK